MTKHEEPVLAPTAPANKSSDSALAIVSMVLGVTSLTGPGLLFGIPAIILASIAIKRNEPNRGLSITGLVTGIISTIVSFFFLVLIVCAIIWGVNNPEVDTNSNSHGPSSPGEMFDSSKT